MKKIILGISFFFIFNTVATRAQNIFKAAEKGNLEVIKKLLVNNISDINLRDNNGKTALSIAAEKGYPDMVKYLIEKGADVSTQNKYGTTPLHYASYYNYIGIVRLLLESDARLNLHSDFTATAISFAATRGNTEIVKMLVEKGADVNIPDNQNKSPLYYAAGEGHLEAVKLLLDAGADKNIITQNGENILHSACIGSNKDIVALFMDMKRSFGEVNKYGKTPLFYAAVNGNSEIVNMIMEKIHTDLKMITNDGNTYLHAAAEGNLKDFALKCIEHGVDINAANAFGLTPLDISEKYNKPEMIEFLKQHGAKIHQVVELTGSYVDNNEPGLTPVVFAPGIISLPDFNERDVTFTPDGSEIYFTRYPVDKTWNIMTMKKQNNVWIAPQKARISGKFLDAEASVTRDGSKIFFISGRPKNDSIPAGAIEIWFANRENGDWGNPELLGDKFSGGYYPTFTDNGTMYFTDANTNISKSLLVDGEYKEVINLGDSINTEESEYNALIAPDESYLIFTSKGWGKGYGNDDLYISFRKEDGTWTKARNMGPVINSFAREYCPALSYDGKYFFFCSSRYETEDIFWVSAKIIDDLRPEK